MSPKKTDPSDSNADQAHEHHARAPRMRLRNYFLTGVVIVAPVAITIYLTVSFVMWADRVVKPFIPAKYNPDTYLPFAVPGVGLVVAILMITLLGFLTANLVGRSVVAYGESLLDRMPLVRSLYRGLKQIFETALDQKSQSFQKVGLIQYPRPGIWAIGFISAETKGELSHKLVEQGVEDTVGIFIPTTPNPTSGFILFLPRDEIIELDMSVEDGAKLVISAGLVTPEFDPVTGKTTVTYKKSA